MKKWEKLKNISLNRVDKDSFYLYQAEHNCFDITRAEVFTKGYISQSLSRLPNEAENTAGSGRQTLRAYFLEELRKS